MLWNNVPLPWCVMMTMEWIWVRRLKCVWSWKRWYVGYIYDNWECFDFRNGIFWYLHLPHPLRIFHFESHVKNKWICTCIVRDESKAQCWRAVLAICRVIACQSQTSSLEYGQISNNGSSEVLRPSWWDWVVSGSWLLEPILPLHLPDDLLYLTLIDTFRFCRLCYHSLSSPSILSTSLIPFWTQIWSNVAHLNL